MPPAIIEDKYIADIQNTYKDTINLISSILRLEITIDIFLKLLGRIKIVAKKSLSIVIDKATKAFNLGIIEGVKGGAKGGIKGGAKGGVKGGIKRGIKRGAKGGAKGATKRGGKRDNSYYK